MSIVECVDFLLLSDNKIGLEDCIDLANNSKSVVAILYDDPITPLPAKISNIADAPINIDRTFVSAPRSHGAF
ncbi:hypothetical protein [Vibrio anguillarum]|uniref:hypothetical protein n=3 Tax=Vibrio anguillarum TaxID=55601 RepID=UPI00188C2A97|nr:hypothetical protein [Vibrio anguillarum]